MFRFQIFRSDGGTFVIPALSGETLLSELFPNGNEPVELSVLVILLVP